MAQSAGFPPTHSCRCFSEIRPIRLAATLRGQSLAIGRNLLEQELGVNPFKFGMIGSTDSHTSLATADQDNFFGKHSGAEPSATRATHAFLASSDGKVKIMGWEMTASGYAAQ
jgi:hypothetical protein